MANMPANIRISAQFPFPAAVQGAAPIVLTKLNGVWTVSLQIAPLGVQIPPIGNLATDYILVYDAIANTFFKMPLSAVGSVARAQRSVTATPIVISGTDQILNCNIAAPAACALPSSASRSGVPLTFKDVGGLFQANNLTITPFGTEHIDGALSKVLNINNQCMTLVPANDGVNLGWSIE